MLDTVATGVVRHPLCDDSVDTVAVTLEPVLDFDGALLKRAVKAERDRLARARAEADALAGLGKRASADGGTVHASDSE